MATARISQAPPPNVDPVKATLAFGDRSVPRLKRELNVSNNDLLVVQQALMSLCDTLRSPTSVTTAVKADIPQDLGLLLNHENDIVREKSTEALHHFAAHAVGRTAIIDASLITPVAAKFSDGVAIVRLNAHTILERVSKMQDGAAAVIDASLVKTMIDLVSSEKEDQIQSTILDTLHNTLKLNPNTSLDAGGISVFAKLLGHTSSDVVARAARNMMDITVPLAGKNAACEEGTLTPLIGLLSQPFKTADVLLSACAAIMSIMITTEGKLKAVSEGVVSKLPALLDYEDERVILNAIKLITVASEAPQARAALQGVLPRLRELKEFRGDRLDVMAVSRSATTAIDTITWRP